MTNEPIPDDIMQAARKAMVDGFNACVRFRKGFCTCDPGAIDGCKKQVSAIANALMAERAKLGAELATLRAENERLRSVLDEARRAIGEHFAPNDCYATGPATGDAFRDLIECPACSFILKYDATRAALKGGE